MGFLNLLILYTELAHKLIITLMFILIFTIITLIPSFTFTIRLIFILILNHFHKYLVSVHTMHFQCAVET